VGPDGATRTRRRLTSRRAQLAHQRTREKTQVHALLYRNLVGWPPVSDVLGVAGRRWLAGLQLAADERLILAGGLRQIEALDAEINAVGAIARQALGYAEMRRLLTIPRIDAVSACALVGAQGEIGRFANARALVAYLGLDPRVAQIGQGPARGGRISKASRRLGPRTTFCSSRATGSRGPGGCGRDSGAHQDAVWRRGSAAGL
jgi:transposase